MLVTLYHTHTLLAHVIGIKAFEMCDTILCGDVCFNSFIQWRLTLVATRKWLGFAFFSPCDLSLYLLVIFWLCNLVYSLTGFANLRPVIQSVIFTVLHLTGTAFSVAPLEAHRLYRTSCRAYSGPSPQLNINSCFHSRYFVLYSQFTSTTPMRLNSTQQLRWVAS